MYDAVRIRLLAAMSGLVAFSLSAQTVPAQINYQGRLTDNSPAQAPFTGTASMQFAIYDAAAGGVMLWREPAAAATGTAIAVNNGVFSYQLGSAVPIPTSVFATGAIRYLEIVLNPAGAAEALTPRQAMTSTGYAQRAAGAGDSAQLGGVAAASWQKAMATPACAAGTVYSAINQDGTATCVAPQSMLALPMTLSNNSPSTGLAIYNNGTGGAMLVNSQNATATGAALSVVNYGTAAALQSQAYGTGPAASFATLGAADALQVTAGTGRAALFTGNVAVSGAMTVGSGMTVTGSLSASSLALSGTLSAASFSGSGAGLTNLNASALTTGTVAATLLPATVVSQGDNITRLANDAGYLTAIAADARYARPGQSPKQLATLRWYGVNQGLPGFPAGTGPYLMACDGENVWTTNVNGNAVSKIRITDGALLASYPTGLSPIGIVYDGAFIWVANNGANTVSKLKIADGTIVGTYAVGISPSWLAYDGAYIWSANYGSSSVTKIRAADGFVVGSYPVGSWPIGIAYDGASLWVTNSGASAVQRLNPADGTVTGTFPTGLNPRSVVFDGTFIWTANLDANTVTRLRASDGSAAGTFTVGAQPRGMVFDGTSVWIANNAANTVTRLRASDGATLGTYAAGTGPFGLTFDGVSVWVANSNANTVSKF